MLLTFFYQYKTSLNWVYSGVSGTLEDAKQCSVDSVKNILAFGNFDLLGRDTFVILLSIIEIYKKWVLGFIKIL